MLTQLQEANKRQHQYNPLASVDLPLSITPIDYEAIKQLAREHTYAVLDGGTISLQAKNWYTLLYQAKLASSVPPFAVAITTPQTLDRLFLHIPTSKFARSPYNSPVACQRISRYLGALHNVPTDWYVTMATPCEASYYEGHSEQCITEHGNPGITKGEFRPASCVSRYVGTIHNVLVEHEHAKPPEAFRNSLAVAKYLRTGNVNDALCLPAPANVRAKWEQTDDDVEAFRLTDSYANKAATHDTYVLREAVVTGKCKHVYVIEGVKKAAHMMRETGDYAVAVSGCWQYDAPSQSSLLNWSTKATQSATPEQLARQPLPTIAWLIANGVDITFIADVDYATNPSVFDGVNTGVATYLAYNQDRVNIRLQRTKAQCELDGIKQLTNHCSPGNYFSVTTDANRKYGYRTTRLVEHTKGRLKGEVTELPHFKWTASGIDDLSYDRIDNALQTIDLSNAMFNKAMLDNATLDQLIAAQDNQENGVKAMTQPTKTTKKNATRTGGTRTTLKGVALDYLAGVNPREVVVTTDSSGTDLYLYCSTEGRYRQVTADNDSVYYSLLDNLQDLLINDKHIDCVSRFLNQLVQELPAVAALTARDQGFKRISKTKLQQERQLVSFKGGDTINEAGYLQAPSPDVFTFTQLNVSLDECKQAYDRMQAAGWQPIEALSKRLDVGAASAALQLTRFEVVKRILALEIGLPVTGGSYNGLEAIVFQSGCSGGGKTVADNAINSLIGLEYVATNMDLTTLTKNRFAKYNLKGKLVGTASDVLTINEEQETTLRNCYGMTLVEQKNQPAEQALLTPVFRFSSNYDKPYTADVAGSMTRRTLLKKYIAPMADKEWEGYTSPDAMMRDVYAGLLYEQLVVNRVSRHQLEQSFKQLVAACNYQQPRTINNTAQLTIERACNYTGNDSDGLSMAQLYSVASNLAPLYGFDRSKNVANMADALRAMQLTNSSALAQSRGAHPIKLSWCNKLKDYVLHGFTLDKEWLLAFAVESQKGASGRKLEHAFNLGNYVRKHEPLVISSLQRAAICDYKSQLEEEAVNAVAAIK